MRLRPRVVWGGTCVAAVIVFCFIQDRVTADGVRQYILAQQAAQGQGRRITVDSVMRPAVERSVRVGLLVGGAVLATGGVIAAIGRRK